MKESVLEQITADYLNTKGYFTLTNIDQTLVILSDTD